MTAIKSSLLAAGTRIRFTQDLTEQACGDHPALLFAKAGDEGQILSNDAPEGYWVKVDGHSAAFGARSSEFELSAELLVV